MIAAHLNPKSPCRSRQSRSPRSVVLLAALAAGVASGCQTPRLHELTGSDDVEVRLDSGSKAHMPGRRIKFFVDLFNRTETKVDVRGVAIELRASPRGEPETISLRHTWRYRWTVEAPPLRPGKRMTIPVVPEQGVEFPLEILRAGDYDIVAVVNERFTSRPYPLAIVRPDLSRAGGDSTVPAAHRSIEGETRKLPLPGRGSRTDSDEREERS